MFGIRVTPCTKVTGYAYRRVRVSPLLVVDADWRSEEIKAMDRLHTDLAKRAGITKDNHQSFVIDDKLVVRFDDWTMLIGNAADAEIKDWGWW